MVDFKALGKKAAAEGGDQTKSVAGGGDFAPPAEGPCQVRFVGYVELGKQKGTFKGIPEIKEKVELTFELVGKRHPPRELPDGRKIPFLVVVKENFSLNEKANFFKLFQRMNYRQDAQHIVELLGDGYKAEVFHDKWTGKDGKERTDAVLRGPGGYSIAPPRKEDEDSESGWVDIAVAPALSEPKCFIWAQADLQQWASIFIDGVYPERKDEKTGVVTPGKSKNGIQNRIKSAVNFPGSPIETLLLAGGIPLDIPEPGEDDERGDDNPAVGATPAPVQATKPTDDALGGIV